jgi:hypothetical protein
VIKNKTSNLRKKEIAIAKLRKELDEAASQGTLMSLPKELLIEENFSHQDCMGMTVLHIAASNGELHKVPKEFLKQELLLILENGGQNVLHFAAMMGQIEIIPKEIITNENLLTKEEEGNSVYHYLANYGYLDKIPRSLLKEEIILKENDFGKTVLDMAIHGEFKNDLNHLKENVETDGPWAQESILLKSLPTKKIKAIAKESEPDRKKGKVGDPKKLKACQWELKNRKLMDTIRDKTNTLEI